MSRQLFLDAIRRRNSSRQTVFGTGTSIVCQDIIRQVQYDKFAREVQAAQGNGKAGRCVLSSAP